MGRRKVARPIYENPENRIIERRVADVLEQKWNCVCHKLPYSYHADFVAMRGGRVIGFAEVKSRTISYSTHKTAMISEMKRMHCLRLAEHFGVTAKLIYKYDDGIFWIDFSETPDWHEIGGRKNTARDDQDIEIMAHWNRERLNKLCN